MESDTRPSVNKERFVCPHCAAYSHHVWGEMVMRITRANGGTASIPATDEPTEGVIMGNNPPRWGSGYPTWRMSECLSCARRCVWRGTELVYPLQSPLPAPHPDLPSDAAVLYEEARSVEPVSRRAAAALVRAALERFLRGRPEANPKARLIDLIGGLESEVSTSLWQLLTAIRYIGNTSLHGEADDNELVALYITGEASDVVEPFFGAINLLVEELVSAPQRTAALYKMIPQGVRDSAGRKSVE